MSSLVLFGVQWQRQQQRKARGSKGSHQQQLRSSGPSYQKVSGRLSRGVVFIVPPGRPVITIASKNQNLQIVCFDVNALNNEKFPFAGSFTLSSKYDMKGANYSYIVKNLLEQVRSKASEEMLSEFLRSGTSLNLLKLEKEVLLCCPVLSKDIRRNDVPLRNYNGKVVLIVNVASKWQVTLYILVSQIYYIYMCHYFFKAGYS